MPVAAGVDAVELALLEQVAWVVVATAHSSTAAELIFPVALLALQILVAVAAVVAPVIWRMVAARALSFCLIPCQKAQQLNSSLLQHGQHQQAFLPLIIWW
jgi:hypothetical protein